MLRFTLAALLGMAMTTACGGADDSPKSPEGSGGDGGENGGTNEVPAVQDDDGDWVCPSGMALYKADDPAPTCRVEANTTPPEDAEPTDDEDAGLPDATPDPTPTECFDLDGKQCESDRLESCTWWRAPERGDCSFDCLNEWDLRTIQVNTIEASHVYADTCGLIPSDD